MRERETSMILICTGILILFGDWIKSYDITFINSRKCFRKFYLWKLLSGKIVTRNDRKFAPISIKCHEMGSTHQSTRSVYANTKGNIWFGADKVVYYLSFCYLAIIWALSSPACWRNEMRKIQIANGYMAYVWAEAGAINGFPGLSLSISLCACVWTKCHVVDLLSILWHGRKLCITGIPSLSADVFIFMTIDRHR